MTYESLGNNRMHGTGSLTPHEEAIWILEWFDVVLRLQKEQQLKAKHKNSVKAH